MRRKENPLIDGKLIEPGGGRGGGGTPYSRFQAKRQAAKEKAGLSSPSLLDKPTRYEIWSKSQGKKVGEANSLRGANRAIDRRDNIYGGYDHFKKKVGPK